MKPSMLIVLLLLLVSKISLFSQELDSESFPGFFQRDELMEITLKFDLTKFKKEKPKEEYYDAILSVHSGDNDSVSYDIRLRARGNFRHNMCAIPPIRLNFSDCENKPEELGEENNVKLVTHCINSEKYEQYLLKEYLIYKMYNVITDSSLQARLLKIKYIDTGKNNKVDTRYGFIIEPIKSLASRAGAIEKEDVVVRESYIDQDMYDKLCLFQYMIGNDDWFLPKLHNLKLIEPLEGNKQILGAIPYDFDFAGMINTHYALPNTYWGLTNIRERIYVGPCRSDESIRALMQEFLNRKDEIYAVINSTPGLTEKDLKRVVDYIDSYYDLYKKDQLFRSIKSTCLE